MPTLVVLVSFHVFLSQKPKELWGVKGGTKYLRAWPIPSCLPFRGESTRTHVLPIISFEAKKMAWGKFSLARESHKFPSSHKNSFFSNASFHGKTADLEGKGKLFSRGNYPSEGKFSLSGIIRPIFPRRENFTLSGLPNANAKSQRFSYAISQIASLPPVVALNRSSKSQIAASYAAFWHAISQIALPSFL